MPDYRAFPKNAAKLPARQSIAIYRNRLQLQVLTWFHCDKICIQNIGNVPLIEHLPASNYTK
jgi:hypothetical protein